MCIAILEAVLSVAVKLAGGVHNICEMYHLESWNKPNAFSEIKDFQVLWQERTKADLKEL